MSENEAPKRGRRKKLGQAELELDTRLAEAVKERAKLYASVTELMIAQTKLQRVEQEIESLISVQHRLSGTSISLTPVPIKISPIPLISDQPFPPGVSSIPAKQSSPVPANPVEAIMGEGGFR